MGAALADEEMGGVVVTGVVALLTPDWRLTRGWAVGAVKGTVGSAAEEVVAVIDESSEKSTLYPAVELPASGGSSTGHKLN